MPEGQQHEELDGSAEPGAVATAEHEGEEREGQERPLELAELAKRERPDIEVVDDPALEARQRAADGDADVDDWERVTAWLLEDTAEVVTRQLKLSVGDPKAPPMPWIIRAIPIDVIRSAEREARSGGGNRAARRGNAQDSYDDLKANLRVMVEGTVRPDLAAVAKQEGLADATVLLRRRFAYKPGIITQVAGEIMALSGFDSDDVQAAEN